MDMKLERNEEHNGLELSFTERPDQAVIDRIKEHGFRWHLKKKIWFAKDTPDRRDFLADFLGISLPQSKDAQPDRSSGTLSSHGDQDSSPPEKKPNTFASHYDSIGDAMILGRADISLLSYMQAYFADLQCSYHRTYGGDSIALTDLSDAGKVGKTCRTWRIYPRSYGEQITDKLHNEEDIQTCKDLYKALKEGREFTSVRVSVQDEKAVEIFSPFQEVKPLKSIPERWNKRNFAIAALSGQIYRGEVAYRYTDDYAMDAAYNFGSGAGLNMPSFVRRAVEDWGQLTSVHAQDDADKQAGTVTLSYSEHSNSGKTLWFDLHCDIAEGKRRAEERQSGLDRYNKMMELSCIQVSADQIDPKKLYVLQQLDKSGNTGRYEVRKENISGYVLRDRIQEDYVRDILSVEPMAIHPDHIYEVSNFFHHPSAELLDDPRVISCGNCKCIVFGKALMELIAEEIHLPHIDEETHEYGPTFEKAEAKLQMFADGRSSFFVHNATDYRDSLARLRSEHTRAAERSGSLDDIIRGAAARAGNPHENADKEKVVPFLRG